MATIRDKYVLDVDVRGGVDKLNKLGAAGEGVKKRFLGVKTAIGGAVTALGAIGVGKLVSGVAEVSARTQDLKTALETVTGSAQGANDAFKFIQDFATKTPFDIDTLTQTFIKLKASGIEPTEELLTAFGDAASVSTDKVGAMAAAADLFSRSVSGGLGLEDLNRLADRGIAVFPILEEKLGLARLEVSEYGKTAEGAAKIQQALIEGFQEEFGGGMERSVQNLSTSLSNMGIAADNALLAVGEGGLNDGIQAVTKAITEMFNENEGLAKSLGAFLGGVLKELPAAFETVVEMVKPLAPLFELLGTVTKEIVIPFLGALFEVLGSIASALQPVVDVLIPAFKTGLEAIANLGTTVYESIQSIINIVEQMTDRVLGSFSGLVDGVTAKAKQFKDTVIGFFSDTEDEVVGNSIIPDMVDAILGEFDRLNSGTNQKVGTTARDVTNSFDGIANNISGGFNQYVNSALNGIDAQVRMTADGIEFRVNDLENIIGTTFNGLSGTISNVLGSIGNIGGGASGGGLLDGIFDTVGDLFGGFFAEGGRLPRGKFGVVGERGPELITGPADITPLDKLAGREQTVVYNINAVDARSFKNLLASDPGYIHALAQKGARRVPGRF